MIAQIIYASIIAAILIASALHVVGLTWRQAAAVAILLSAAVGWSALSTAGQL